MPGTEDAGKSAARAGETGHLFGHVLGFATWAVRLVLRPELKIGKLGLAFVAFVFINGHFIFLGAPFFGSVIKL